MKALILRICILTVFFILLINCKKKDKYEFNKINVEEFNYLKDTINTKTVINLYSINCGGCIFEYQQVKKFCKKNNIQLVNISTIDRSLNNEDILELKNISKKLKIENSYYIDTNSVSINAKNIYSILDEFSIKIKTNYYKSLSAPYLIYLDKNGQVLKEFNNINDFFNYIKTGNIKNLQ